MTKLSKWKRYSANDIYTSIADGIIKEDDVWKYIPENKAPRRLKKIIKNLSAYVDFENVKYCKKNPMFQSIRYHCMTPYYLKLDDIFFSRLKPTDNKWDEIVVSKYNLVFFKNKCTERWIILDYSEDEEYKELGGTPRPGYVRIFPPKDLDNKLRALRKKTKTNIYLATIPKALNFQDIRMILRNHYHDKTKYGGKMIHSWLQADNEYLDMKNKTTYLELHPSIGSFGFKIRPEYFEIENDLYNWIFKK